MLIDSENLIARIDKCYQESAKTGLRLEPVMAIRDIKALISVMPEVEAVPVKHGRWIENEGFDGDSYYTCSSCGCDWTTIDGTPTENNMRYCPECGSRMDLEEQDAKEET